MPGKKRFAHPAIALGDRFGRLKVIEPAPAHYTQNGVAYPRWLCICDCGEVRPFVAASLKRGHSQSCGCMRKDTLVKTFTKHGHAVNKARSGTYRSWYAMIQRCENPSFKHFSRYGGRGINVCSRWRRGDGTLSGFQCFLADMGDRPDAALTLDRYPDKDGDYSPSNCRWASRKEQSRNREVTRTFLLDGRSMLLREWAEEFAVNLSTLRGRVSRGMPLREALRAGKSIP